MATKAYLDIVKHADLGNKGLVVTVEEDNEILGHVMIGRASVVWFEKGAKARGYKVSWRELQKWMMSRDEEQQASRPG